MPKATAVAARKRGRPKSSGLSPKRQQIVDYIKQHPGCSLKDVATATGISYASVRTTVAGMKRNGSWPTGLITAKGGRPKGATTKVARKAKRAGRKTARASVRTTAAAVRGLNPLLPGALALVQVEDALFGVLVDPELPITDAALVEGFKLIRASRSFRKELGI